MIIARSSGVPGAPVDATFITQTPSATLTSEQALSALATGILKSTTGTGVVSIATTSDIAALLPVVDETAIVYETGVPANTLTFDVTPFTAARIVTWPDSNMTVAGLEVANIFTAAQTVKVDTATTNAILNVQTIGANVTGAGVGAAGFGPGVLFTGESSTTADQNMARIAAVWSTATHATRSADIVFSTVNNAAALAEAARITSTKKFGVGTKNIDNKHSYVVANVSSNGVATGLGVYNYVSGAVNGSGLILGFARNQEDTPLTVINGDRLGFFLASGYEGTNWLNPVGITFKVDGVVSTGVLPGGIEIETGTSSSRTTRIKVTSSGDFFLYGANYNLIETDSSDDEIWIGNNAASKISLFAATPVIQPATTGTTAGFTAGAGAAVLVDSTFDGNLGGSAYTIGDIVLALIQVGILAA